MFFSICLAVDLFTFEIFTQVLLLIPGMPSRPSFPGIPSAPALPENDKFSNNKNTFTFDEKSLK